MSKLADKVKAFFKAAEKETVVATVHARHTSISADRTFLKMAAVAVFTMAAGMGVMVNVESAAHADQKDVQVANSNYPTTAKAEYWQRLSSVVKNDEALSEFGFAPHFMPDEKQQKRINELDAQAQQEFNRIALAPNPRDQGALISKVNEENDTLISDIRLVQTTLDKACAASTFTDVKTGFHNAIFLCTTPDGKATIAKQKTIDTVGDILEIGKFDGNDVYYSMGHGNGAGFIDAPGAKAPVIFIEHDLVENIKMLGIDAQEQQAILSFFIARESAHLKLYKSPKDATFTEESMETLSDAMGIRALIDNGMSEERALSVAQTAFECSLHTQVDALGEITPDVRNSLTIESVTRFTNAAMTLHQGVHLLDENLPTSGEDAKTLKDYARGNV